MRTIGTRVYGIRTPIIKEDDDLVSIIVNSLLQAAKDNGITFCDNDVVGVTEAVVARAQGNYATVDQIAACVRSIFPSGPVGVVFPILSRNRFAMLLKGIAKGADEIIVQLSYPADEVGNQLIDPDAVFDANLNTFTDVLDEPRFRELFGQEVTHRFTGVDYVRYYGSLAPNIRVILANNPLEILQHAKQIIAADIHKRSHTKRSLQKGGAQKVVGLDDIMTSPIDGSGCNPQYGLLGSNKATENKVKLFPRGCEAFVEALAGRLCEVTGKNIEVLVYGDGGFKDPVGGIWELADPVIAPAFTKGLSGTPNELKLKFLADNKFSSLRGEELEHALKNEIRQKDASLMGKMESEGTTPRQLTDLLGSLCDLTSGSGDKGTPVILIQGYFDNFAS